MKTFFNQHQHSYPFAVCRNSAEKQNNTDQLKEEAIAEHIKAIAKGSSALQSEDLTDLMSYYLSVAG
ncbi:hypothetical protein [Pedobacter hartonius]|uniref:Uncharacterized protein n=1 Tax=Pedobacter hartonius TaxID=425514 RepID=A0A1H3XB12_9SPHI|nr:hypothetical protein [Pedobacter hartonius]SDZ96539.1 hypothetical protein SAMN05443550_101560 [Pedobacter hartonius]